jgi:hypothetical protein
MHTAILSKNLKVIAHLEDLVLDGRIMKVKGKVVPLL